MPGQVEANSDCVNARSETSSYCPSLRVKNTFLVPGVIDSVDIVKAPKFMPLDPSVANMMKTTCSPLSAPGVNGVELNLSVVVEIGKLR